MESNEPSGAPPTSTSRELAAEARDLGLTSAEVVTTIGLSHNPLNQVTGSIGVVELGEGRAIRKVVTPSGEGADHWAASDEPTHWNYWRREIEVYRSDLAGRLGLGAPRLLGSVDLPDGGVALWLEAVEGTTGAELGIEGMAAAARALGSSQGLAEQPDDSWLSKGFIAEYAAAKPVDHGLLDDDAVWAHPVIADAWTDETRSAARLLWTERSRLLAILARLPRVVGHLDVWPNNIVRRSDGTCVFLDWAFTGDAALGEDIGNLIPDAIVDLLVPVDAATELENRVLTAYGKGLSGAGWSGDERLVRLGMTAAAVKYHWLAPLLLGRVTDERHYAYGIEVPALELYATRGRALELLGRWAAEALDSAAEFGLA